MREIVQQAHEGNMEFFQPFIELLNTNVPLTNKTEETDYNEEETEEE